MIGKVVAAKSMDNKAMPYIVGGVVIVGVVVLYFGILKPVLCKVGVLECKAGRRKAKSMKEIMQLGGFSPNYWETHSPSISHQRAKVLADQIEDAAGIINDNEDQMYAAIQEAGSMANLSLIAYYFNIRFKKSLSNFLVYYLDEDSEIEKLDNIISKFPDYRQAK